MKKYVSILLCALLVLGMFAACGNSKPAETVQSVPALEALQTIWNAFGEGEKFPVMGGNMEAGVMDGPAVYDKAYAENMTYNLLIPAEQIGNVTEAASMIHAMNANTFTGAAYNLAEGVAAADFAAAMQAAVQGNMWMCGFPERLIIADVGGAVVVAFGVADVMTPFQEHLTASYPNAQLLVDEPIA